MEINTRNQAADKGLLRYWDGKPCKRGHNSERYTRNGVCIECNREDTYARREDIRRRIALARGE
jgi:hypothetical protein